MRSQITRDIADNRMLKVGGYIFCLESGAADGPHSVLVGLSLLYAKGAVLQPLKMLRQPLEMLRAPVNLSRCYTARRRDRRLSLWTPSTARTNASDAALLCCSPRDCDCTQILCLTGALAAYTDYTHQARSVPLAPEHSALRCPAAPATPQRLPLPL